MRLILRLMALSLITALSFGQDIKAVSSGHTLGDPSAIRGGVLWDQLTGATPGVIDTFTSQIGSALEAIESHGADDFVVPGGIGGWDLNSITVLGTLFNCGGGGCPTIDSFTVNFYENSGGLPGAQIYSYSGLSYTTSPSGSLTLFDISYPTSFFPPGNYWVSVQAREDFCITTTTLCDGGQNGQFGWAEAGDPGTFTNPFGGTNPSAWQNPDGLFSLGCTSWGARDATCGLGTTPPAQAPAAPDFAFQLDGTEALCAVTSITASGNTVTVTGTPGCVIDIYYSANCDYSTIDPMDPNVTYVGTFTIGPGGYVETGLPVENDVCYYVTFEGGGPVLAVSARSVPTMSQWMLIVFSLLLLFAALGQAQKRKNQVG